MPVSQLNAAVVGVGFMGRQHARVYNEHPIANLRAIIDVDEDRAGSVATEYDVPTTATDVADALATEDIDVLTVATPEEYHVLPTTTALEHDVNVLLEKPIAADVDDAETIGAAVEDSSADLMMGFVCRFDPRYTGLKEELETGDFGNILGVQAARIAPRAMYDMAAEWSHPLYYLTVHDFDMLRWYLDTEVTQVYADASEGLDDIDTPAVVHSLLRFNNGTTATVETSWARSDYPTEMTEEIRITGTESYSRLVIENDDVEVNTDPSYRYRDISEIHGKFNGNLQREIDYFLECLQDGTEPMVDWQDGLATLRIANAVIESLETDAPVELE
jgi:UDP-N-acetylglucosamine 3-dehydrogenase